MKFIEVLLMWILAFVAPLCLGQLTLDQEFFRLTEVLVSVYCGYLLFLAALLGLAFLNGAPFRRTTLWAIGIHLLVSSITSMPISFVIGAGLGILIFAWLTAWSINQWLARSV